MDPFPEFNYLSPMPPVVTIGVSGMLSLSRAGGDIGMGGGGQSSLVLECNTSPVHKLVCLRKELLGKYEDRSEVPC